MAFQLTHAQLEDLWLLAGGPIAAADTAAAIAQAESGGCQYALAGPVDIRPVKACTWHRTNLENSCGFWQINLRAHPAYKAPAIFDQLVNAGAAVAISRGGLDFGPWSTYTNGAYKQFLTSGGTPGPQPGPSEPPTFPVAAANSLRGWADLRNSLGRHLPTQLEQSRRLRRGALSAIGRAHRLGR